MERGQERRGGVQYCARKRAGEVHRSVGRYVCSRSVYGWTCGVNVDDGCVSVGKKRADIKDMRGEASASDGSSQRQFVLRSVYTSPG